MKRDDDLAGFDGSHPCPKCNSREVSLEILNEPKLSKLDDPVTYSPSESKFRIHCRGCKVSTKLETRLIDAVNQWNTFKDGSDE